MSERAPQVGDTPAFKPGTVVEGVNSFANMAYLSHPDEPDGVHIATRFLTFIPPPYIEPELRPGDIVRSVGEADEREWAYVPDDVFGQVGNAVFLSLGGTVWRWGYRSDLPDRIRVVSRREDRR